MNKTITIRNINPAFGESITFTGETLELAVSGMATTVSACGPEYAVTSDDLIEGRDFAISNIATAKIYKVTCTKAFVASMELGTGFSLTPWGNNTDQYEGHDDGGQNYILPEGYSLAETTIGEMMIWDAQDKPCSILMHSSGRPQLVGSDPHKMPVLGIA